MEEFICKLPLNHNQINCSKISDGELDYHHIAYYDVIIFDQTSNPSISKYLDFAKNLNKMVIYYLEENYFTKFADINLDNYLGRTEVKYAIMDFISRADLVIANNQKLQEAAGKYNKNLFTPEICADSLIWSEIKYRFEDNQKVSQLKTKNLLEAYYNSTKKPPRVLAVVAGLIPSVDIGLVQPLTYLAMYEKIQWQLILETELDCGKIVNSDVIIFQRICNPDIVPYLEYAKVLEKGIIYDIDDNFFVIPSDTSLGAYYRQPVIQQTLIRFMQLSDIVKVGSKELAAIAKNYNSQIELQPFSFDFSLIEGVSKKETQEGIITIGYAGTITHGPDFAPVVPALKRILEEYQGMVKIEFMGYIPTELEQHEGVSFSEYNPNYDEFIREKYRRSWDIGIAPLIDTPSNRSKTNNKFREYGACGIAGIYVNLPIYTDCVEDGVTGLITEHTENGWYEVIKNLIENPDLRKTIALNAFHYVRDNYSIAVSAKAWEEIINRYEGKEADFEKAFILALKIKKRNTAIINPLKSFLSSLKRFIKTKLKQI